jgi:hypothetical protein
MPIAADGLSTLPPASLGKKTLFCSIWHCCAECKELALFSWYYRLQTCLASGSGEPGFYPFNACLQSPGAQTSGDYHVCCPLFRPGSQVASTEQERAPLENC